MTRLLLVCAPPRDFSRACREAEAAGWTRSRPSIYRSREMFCCLFERSTTSKEQIAMSTSAFDPTAFMQAQHTGANDTIYRACPIGDYPGVIDKVEPREWKSKDGTKSGIAADILWSVDSDAVRQELGRDKVIVRQGIMLDVTPSGGLDMGQGKNVNLGRLREAVGLNDPSQPFSFGMLVGKVAKIKVEHEIYNNAPMAKVTAVARL